MNPYEIANGLVEDPDLFTAGDRLIQFSEAAMREKNRKSAVDFLYKGMYSYFSHLIKLPFDLPFGIEKNEIDCCDFADGYGAVGVYLAKLLSMARTTPVKTLGRIEEIGSMLNEEPYCEPVGKVISREEIQSILDYLDLEFGAKKAIFNERDVILLFPDSHGECNSQIWPVHDEDGIRLHHIYYHMGEAAAERGTDPRYVFCYGLGMALQMRYLDTAERAVSDELLRVLEIDFPAIRRLDEEEQGHILYDALAMGMLHESPFEDADDHDRVTPDSKAFFQEIFRAMCKKAVEGGRIEVAYPSLGEPGFVRYRPELR